MRSARLAGWIVGALALAVVLSLVAPGVVILAGFALVVPIAIVAKVRAGRHAEAPRSGMRPRRSCRQRRLSSATAPPRPAPRWTGVQRCVPSSRASQSLERRRFALGAIRVALAMLGRPHRVRSGILAAGLAIAFAAGLLGFSRPTVGHDGLGSMSVLLPPVMLFMIGLICARGDEVAAFGVETGILAAFTTLVAVAVVFRIEAARWFDVAHVYVLDGEYADADTSRSAVLDAVHPIILLVHLLFWLPWLDARRPRRSGSKATWRCVSAVISLTSNHAFLPPLTSALDAGNRPTTS